MTEVLGTLPFGVPDALAKEVRADLERRIGRAVDAARNVDRTRLAGSGFKARTLDLYLPVLPAYEMPVPASFTVSRVSAPAIDPAEFALRYSGAVPDAVQPKVVDGSFGFREAHAVPAGRDVEFATRRVDYIFSVPGAAGSWLAVVFTALDGGRADDEAAPALTDLFDGVMTTFRWSYGD